MSSGLSRLEGSGDLIVTSYPRVGGFPDDPVPTGEDAPVVERCHAEREHGARGGGWAPGRAPRGGGVRPCASFNRR